MSDATSSSNPITPLAPTGVETYTPKIGLETTVKLNVLNYLLCAQAFRIFIGAQSKLMHLLARRLLLRPYLHYMAFW